MRKRESAKVNMCKLRKRDAKDFAFYTSPSGVDLSHFRIVSKTCEFSTNVQLGLRNETFGFLLQIKINLKIIVYKL